MSKPSRTMKRTTSVFPQTPSRAYRATPYPLPERSIEGVSWKEKKRLLDLLEEEEEDEEMEEPIEPPRAVKVEKEGKGSERMKGKLFVRHSPTSNLSSNASRNLLEASRATPAIRALATKSANIPGVTRLTTAQPEDPHAQPQIPSTPVKPQRSPSKLQEFKVPEPPTKPRPPKKAKMQVKVDRKSLEPPKVTSSNMIGKGGERAVENSFFDSIGKTRDIYVQGSGMVVKVRVERPLYMDDSPAAIGEHVFAHITSSLQYLMVPFLHHLTFRHTAPITERVCYIRDIPVIYHMEHVAHGQGNKYDRSDSGDECLMWEDMLVITPYLVMKEQENGQE